jgi:hypothetical protein
MMSPQDTRKGFPPVEKQPVVDKSAARVATQTKPEQSDLMGWKMYDPNAWRAEWAANKKRR